MDIPNINRMLVNNIKMDIQPGAINLYYGKTRLFVKTGCWTCPYGIGDNNTMVCIIPDIYCERLTLLDNLARTIIFQNYKKLFGEDLPDQTNIDDIPYTPLIKTLEDGLECAKIQVTEKMKVFDCNGEKIIDYVSCLSRQFSAYFLFDMSTISVHKGFASWSLWPLQIKIKHYCILPEGCLIYDTEEQLIQALLSRNSVSSSVRSEEFDAVIDFDQDVNELL